MKTVLVAWVACLLCSCTQVNYTTYVGQQRDWPFASGAAVRRDFALPVYQGPPERPYRVLGWVQVENARRGMWRRSGGVEFAVREAARRGADAVILLPSQTAGSGTSTRLGEGQARVIAIKFL